MELVIKIGPKNWFYTPWPSNFDDYINVLLKMETDEKFVFVSRLYPIFIKFVKVS